MGAFADFADLVHGPEAEWDRSAAAVTQLRCRNGSDDQQRNQGNGPVPEFPERSGLVKDMQKITDAARNKWVSNLMMGWHYSRIIDLQGSKSLALIDLLRKFDKSFALTGKIMETWEETGLLRI